MFTHITRQSSNAKVGPIPVTTTAEDSCPSSCPFNSTNEGGCYANHGPLMLHWRKVSNGERGVPFEEFLNQVKSFPEGQLWRHNQAGDLPGEDETIDHDALMDLVESANHTRGFTYTHKLQDEALESVRQANEGGFTVNLSANGLAHADTLANTEAGPVVTVLPEDQMENTKTPEGRDVVVCPAVTHDSVTCATCGLCQKQSSGDGERPVIGFPAHGVKSKNVTKVAIQND